MTSPSLRRAANWVLLPAAGILIGLLVCEGLLRFAGISFPVFDTYDALRGTALRPGKEGWYQKEGKAYLRINSLGYRDRDHDIAKPAGTFRIAVLGDSFTEARQVAREDTYWALLARGLTDSCPSVAGKKVEVLNFGVGGYGTTEALLTLRKDALRFSPDLVLLAFFSGNDVRDNSKTLASRESWRMPRPYFVYSNGGLIFEKTPQPGLFQRLLVEGVHQSRLLELVNEIRRIRAVRAAVSDVTAGLEAKDPEGIYAHPEDPAWQEAWLITEQLLMRVNQEAAAGGARLILAIVPTPLQVHPDTALRQASERNLGVQDLFYVDRKLAAIGQRLGFTVIGLAERLQKIASEKGTYFHGFNNTAFGDGHWNEAGHRQAAEILTEQICTKVLTH